MECVRTGWPSSVSHDGLKPYFTWRTEQTVHQGCLRGARVVSPLECQNRIVDQLHSGHPGIVQMKELARSYTWCPRIYVDLGEKVKNCQECQHQPSQPNKVPFHPWVWPTRPWEHVHLGFAVLFMQHYFLVKVDAHSKRPEVFALQCTTSEKTIQCLRELSAVLGSPRLLSWTTDPSFIQNSFRNTLN